MLEHAIVGVDHSPATGRLYEELGRLTRLGVERATLVTVLGGPYPQAPQERHRDHYLARLQELADGLPGLTCDVQVRSGHPAAELRQTAAETGADLIAAGSHGHTPWRDLFLGSTVLDLARTSRVPILLLPLAAEMDGRGGGVVLATDGSASAAAAEASALRLGQQLGGCAVTVLRPGRDTDDEQARAWNHRRQLEPTLAPRVDHGSLPATIGSVANEQAADVIIVGSRGHTPLAGLLLGSTAEHLLRTADRPVLLVPGER